MRLKSGKFAFLDCLSGVTNWRDNYVGSGEFSKSLEKSCGKKIGAVDPSLCEMQILTVCAFQTPTTGVLC